jgi:signal transduction histidine kinase
MRPRRQKRALLVSASLFALLACFAAATSLYFAVKNRSPAYRDAFVQNKQDGWQPFGGTWEIVSGAMQNSSDERGAKLLNGSINWTNYAVEADVQLLGEGGDAGLLIRTSHEEEGVDAYHGYFAGLRADDNALILGRADYGWHEFQATPVHSGVQSQHWYHLVFIAYECSLAVSATGQSGTTTVTAIRDPACVGAGRFGLQSYATGALWRNVVVHPANQQTFTSLVGGTAVPTPSGHDVALPEESADNSSSGMREQIDREMRDHHSDLNARTINTLRLLPPNTPTPVIVHGVVTLVSPILFIQDSTGGLAIPGGRSTRPLQIGDAIEAKGNAVLHDFSSVLKDAEVRPLWTHTPVSPVAISASQAATGAFDAQYVELEGQVIKLEVIHERTLIMTLEEGRQSFRAIVNGKNLKSAAERISMQSRVRLRGICVVDPEYTRDLTPVALLLPSIDDVEVVKDPPWWNTGHIVALIIGFLLLLLATQATYGFTAKSRLRAIIGERERLTHEMHDTVAQSFAGIGFQLEAIRDDTIQDQHLRPQLNSAIQMVRDSHREAKRSIAALRPQDIESLGLVGTLDLHVRRIVGTGGIEVTTRMIGAERPIPSTIADTILRIGQEATANAVRHGQPKKLTLTIIYDEAALGLMIQDNGIGFRVADESDGFGIRGMKKRAESIAADLKLSSAPGIGTAVEVVAPIPPPFLHRAWPAFIWKTFRRHLHNGATSQ